MGPPLRIVRLSALAGPRSNGIDRRRSLAVLAPRDWTGPAHAPDRRDPRSKAEKLGRERQPPRGRLPDPEPSVRRLRGERPPWSHRRGHRGGDPRPDERRRPDRGRGAAGCGRLQGGPAQPVDVPGPARGAGPAAGPQRPPVRRRPRKRTAAASHPRGCGAHAAAGRDRRLHRLLCLDLPRHQRRTAVPPRQSATAELQVGSHRLPRPSLEYRGQRRARPAAGGPSAAPRRQPAGDAPLPRAGL